MNGPIFLKLNKEHITSHLQYKHSGTFANRKCEELSYPQNPKMCDPIVVTLLKMQPHYGQSSRENAICCDCQATYIGETGRNISMRLTEHKRATRNDDVNNHIAVHHLQTKQQIDWDSATCITYSTDYLQRLSLESWFTNLEQMLLNCNQQLPAPYKGLTDVNQAKLTTRKRLDN